MISHDPKSRPIGIREVWSHNLESEFRLIRSLIDEYPFVSMDSEFPGVCYTYAGVGHPSPSALYSLLKKNVDQLNLIQLGLTLTDSEGNLPDPDGNGKRCIWQFNFKDFDIDRDKSAPNSVELLRNQGIDFRKNKEKGVATVQFAELMMSSGLVCNEEVNWVTFHSAYDFGYLLKILMQKRLPDDLSYFMTLLKVYFGTIYDVKYMMRFCNNLYGGLNRVAKALELERVVGKSHQAGSDSLLTWFVFQKIRDSYFSYGGPQKYSGVLYGLEISQ